MILASFALVALAEIDPNCDTDGDGVVDESFFKNEYNEQTQQDFLQNYFALGTSLSPIHAPIPHEAGRGAIGLDLLVLPPLGCAHRAVLAKTKTEETNVTPMAPRPRITFALDGPGPLVIYGGFAYVPPVTVFGTRNTIVAGEIGAGAQVKKFSASGRIHATNQKTVADIATAFDPALEPSVDDFYVASTFGFDAMAGMTFGPVTPYVSIGVTDASTFFLVGDSLVVSNNLHPYAGPVASVGADGLFMERLRLAAEIYAAPGGYSKPKSADGLAMSIDSPSSAAAYGNLVTARVRIGVEL